MNIFKINKTCQIIKDLIPAADSIITFKQNQSLNFYQIYICMNLQGRATKVRIYITIDANFSLHDPVYNF